MIIFLYGADTYRSRQKLKELKDKFRREVDRDGSSLVTIDGETAQMTAINEAVGAPSLFARKRMVIIENILANKSKTTLDELNEYLKKKFSVRKMIKDKIKKNDEDNILIFWSDTAGEKMGKNKLFNFLKKQRFVQNFKPLSNTEATNWVKTEVSGRGAKIRNDAVMHLTSLFGPDLWQLSNEIDKIINYKKGVKREIVEGAGEVIIETEDIENLSRGQADENIFALTDAISRKNKALALKLFEQETELGVPDTYLMHMIVRQFRILMQVRQAVDQGASSRKIIGELKLHPFVVQKSLTQVRGFTLPILKKIFGSLVEIDRKLKTGRANLKTELELLITKL
ncbi:MAG: DNA polymerase III subunit delta [Planctomycetota bacterium]|jgi:DNA polymerase-3 subunit delta